MTYDGSTDAGDDGHDGDDNAGTLLLSLVGSSRVRGWG